MRRRGFLTRAGAVAGLSMAGLPVLVRPAAATTFLSVLTGGSSGVYYPLGIAMAGLFNEQIDGISASAQATKASVENLNLLQRGDGELAFTLADSARHARDGDAEAGFAQPLDRLRHVAAIYPNYIQIVASVESGITSLADLRGMRVSVGAPRSGTELNARAIFGAAGLTYDDFAKVEYLPFAESVDLMKNRQIDATLQSAGLGVGSIRDLALAVPVLLVPVPAEIVAAVGDETYESGTIPAGTYDGQEADVPAAVVRNLLLTHADVDDDLVHAMTGILFDNVDRLAAAHSAARGIVLDAGALESPVPLHPGAERLYRERGILS